MDDLDDFLASLDRYATPTLQSQIDARLNSRTGSLNTDEPEAALPRMRTERSRRDGTDDANRKSRKEEKAAHHAKVHKAKKREKDHGDSNAPADAAAGAEASPAAAAGGETQGDGPPRRKGTKTESQWKCPTCATVNRRGDKACGACGHDRELGSAGWLCDACAFLNPPTNAAGTCANCGHAKPAGLAPLALTAPAVPTQAEPALIDDEDEDDDVTILTGYPRKENADADESDAEYSDSEMDGEDSDIDASDEGFESTSDEDDDDNGAPRDSALVLAEFTSRLAECAHQDLVPADVPPTMSSAGLKPFQLQGLRWMLDREQDKEQMSFSGGVLADIMGMGKTRMMCALTEATRRAPIAETRRGKVLTAATLIICPLSLMSQWVNELRHTVNAKLRILKYHGPVAKKKYSIFEVAEGFDIVITTYQSLACEFKAQTLERPAKLHTIDWFRIILDEAHAIKNPRSRQSRATVALTGARRWVVTATPLQNSVNDFYPLAKFLGLPGFGTRSWWISYINGDPQVGLQRLQVLLSRIMLRRTFGTLGPDGKPLVELPRKTITMHRLDLTQDEKRFYKEVHERARGRVETANTRGAAQLMVFATALEMLTRCRQAVNHVNLAIAALQRKIGIDTVSVMDPEREAVLREQQKAAEAARHAAGARMDAAEAAAQAAAKKVVETFVTKARKKSIGGPYVERVLQEIIDTAGRMQDGTDCTICMDALSGPALLPCAHIFCYDCVKVCVETQRCCPMCKLKVDMKHLLQIPVDGTAPKVNVGSGNRKRDDADAAAADDDGGATILDRLEDHVVGPLASWEPSTKMKCLVDIIRAAGPDEKIVVLSHFTAFLNAFAHVLEREGITSIMYHGGLNMRQRDMVIKKFNVPILPSAPPAAAPGLLMIADVAAPTVDIVALPPGTGDVDAVVEQNPPAPPPAVPTPGGPRVLLATIQSCGVGLNLCVASQLVVSDPSWNPAIEIQAYSRIHRIGQTRPVTIHRVIVKDSVEEAIEALAKSKSNVAELCLDPTRAARLGREELMNLFRPPQREEERARGRGPRGRHHGGSDDEYSEEDSDDVPYGNLSSDDDEDDDDDHDHHVHDVHDDDDDDDDDDHDHDHDDDDVA
jgi:SNF2 family DNA or RNA helicase